MIKRMQEPLRLIREIYRAYRGEMAAVASYTYGHILFEKSLPALSDLLATVSLAEMRHYHALGELLRDLGASHALRTNLQDFSYRYGGNDAEAALPTARHFVEERIEEERLSAQQYETLAEASATQAARELLHRLSKDEAEHAAALEAALMRLAVS